MKPTFPRLTLAVLGASLLLAGCANHPTRAGSKEAASHAPAAAVQNPTAPATRSAESHAAHGTRAAGTTASGQPAQLPDSTGIPACDDYLASYVACHRAAQIYRPDQVQGRYEAIRTSLLRDSQDPKIRPNLATRCNSLASQLRQALHGKSCDSTPAAPSSQAGH
ncbi:hypothetical protein [Frateuria terrea]|uniref:Lipoprotein n=1 Tax=Frateuria terrea TaxID=529704 RepID=A0A1H6R7T5_9GAMM|nr:hypothetical protein [Frateuria terrea]SEI47242.1 hypothetical protein SAMN04487997_0853 [Frateuria terrea]SFP13175.1 hypothetical protein SAMN02927913_0769 [Frateuria terrea]